MATIQWFPGHMSKARRQVQENLKFVDFVTVLVDARLPLSSQHRREAKTINFEQGRPCRSSINKRMASTF